MPWNRRPHARAERRSGSSGSSMVNPPEPGLSNGPGTVPDPRTDWGCGLQLQNHEDRSAVNYFDD